METKLVLISIVLLRLSASQFCPDEYKCSSGSSTPLDITSSYDKALQKLDLSCKHIEILEPDFFSEKNVTNSTSILLNDNCIQLVRAEVFKPLVILRHLFLQNNQISFFHFSTFQSNIYLTTLDLSGNNLKELHPNIFDKNYNLSWVNIARNPLQVSSVQSTIFKLSLNTIDLDTCKKPENSINCFQRTPYLRQLNLTENTVFTVKNLKSYENIEYEDMSKKNCVFSKLINLGYKDTDELRYDPIREVIFSSSATSLMCFCDRLSAWFWCLKGPHPCSGHNVDAYSVLNCSVTSTGTSLFETSPYFSASARSTVTFTETTTTDDQTDFTTDTNTAREYPLSGGTGMFEYVALIVVVAALLVVLFGVTMCGVVFIVRKKRNSNVRDGRMRFRKVSHNTHEESRYAPYRGSQEQIYYEPYDSRQSY